MKQAFLQKKPFTPIITGERITDEDYQHAQTVWRDYHNLYDLSDVLLLADIFENIRNNCMNHYGLDPVWYFSAPGIAWDAALKITKVQLELLSDPDILLMIESGITGGIATISHRHAKANNEYTEAEIDPLKESKFISYLDANNHYGWAMSKQFPTLGF